MLARMGLLKILGYDTTKVVPADTPPTTRSLPASPRTSSVSLAADVRASSSAPQLTPATRTTSADSDVVSTLASDGPALGHRHARSAPHSRSLSTCSASSVASLAQDDGHEGGPLDLGVQARALLCSSLTYSQHVPTARCSADVRGRSAERRITRARAHDDSAADVQPQGADEQNQKQGDQAQEQKANNNDNDRDDAEGSKAAESASPSPASSPSRALSTAVQALRRADPKPVGRRVFEFLSARGDNIVQQFRQCVVHGWRGWEQYRLSEEQVNEFFAGNCKEAEAVADFLLQLGLATDIRTLFSIFTR